MEFKNAITEEEVITWKKEIEDKINSVLQEYNERCNGEYKICFEIKTEPYPLIMSFCPEIVICKDLSIGS